MSEILALIPARAGSKGIPNKNMKELCGKPLLQYTYDAVKRSKMVTRRLLSTDSEEYAEYARLQGIEAQIRPEELAQDNTPMKDVIDYHLKLLGENGYHPDILILLQATSPLRSEKHIDEALEALERDKDADAIVSVIELPHNYMPVKIMKMDKKGYLKFYMDGGERFTTRQELPRLYARNGAAIYAVYVDAYNKTHSLYGTHCLPYFMDWESSVDIDGEEDLDRAKCILSRKIL